MAGPIAPTADIETEEELEAFLEYSNRPHTKEELEKLKADIMSLIKKDDKKGSINDGELPF